MFKSLSGRFLLLAILFVMLAEVLILVPSVARFRQDHLLLRLERAQIASLTLLADDMLDEQLEYELLKNAGVYNVVLHRDDTRQLVLSSPLPGPVDESFDLRDAGPFELIRDALIRLWDRENRLIRVMGEPLREAGVEIEVTMETAELRQAMLQYCLNIIILSTIISLIVAGLLFWAVHFTVVNPIRRLVSAMQAYAADPEDARTTIVPGSEIKELREAEDALQAVEVELTQALRQKGRLAQLGGAVAKVSHDLRNILTVAQLMADRMERSDDPAVQRAAPKLINSISRAISLCEGTLAFGKAEEPAPRLDKVDFTHLVTDVLESEQLSLDASGNSGSVSFDMDIPARMMVRADPEQLHRVVSNLVRNARQAIEATGASGRVVVRGRDEPTHWDVEISDTGPGLPPKAREYLFMPFQGGARKGGTGLGLAIASELIRGHGGTLNLASSDEHGTVFRIYLPKDVSSV